MAAEVTPLRTGQQDDLQSKAAEEIRSIMARRRLTQGDVAQMMGRPQSYVSRIYRGVGAVTLQDVEAFARVLDVHPLVLLGADPAAQSSGSTQSITRTIRCLTAGLHASTDPSSQVDESDAHIHIEPVGDLDYYRRRRAESTEPARPTAVHQAG